MRTVLAFSAASLVSALPFVGEARRDPAAVAIEAGRIGRATGDVSLVGDIDDVQRRAPVLPFVMDRRVTKHDRGNDQRVRGIGKGLSDIADTATKAEASQRPLLERVVSPGGSCQPWRVGRRQS